MQQRFNNSLKLGLVLAAVTFTGVAAAQKGLSDAQVEANVLRALAGSPQLATQSIKTTTVYGTVTLSGSVTDETSRTLAETLASKAPGVQKVVDELTLGDSSSNPAGNGSVANAPESAQSALQDQGQNNGSNPQLQSDGTIAPSNGDQQSATEQASGPQQPYSNEQGRQQSPQQAQYPNGQGSQGYPQGQQYPNDGSTQNGAGAPPVYRRPYNSAPPPNYGYGQQAPNQPYGYGQPAPPPYGAQEAGKPVTVPAGSLIRMRINEGLSSKRVQPGTVFDGTVLNDVIADGEVAIPRGASVQGTIVESKDSGAVSGRGQLALQLTSVNLAGRTYPITSDLWTHDGRDNTGRTVSNAVGLGAFGAVLGAVAGGGPGAALGAVAGGVAGVGVSAAQGRGQVVIPAEAILSFHLTQPAPVTTVSQAEMDRLGYGVQQTRMARRPPPPPPGYYGRPAYYPYAY